MAASSSHPLMTKSLHGSHQSSIQILDSSPGDESIQAIRRWCALHKTDRHSDSDCRAQQESSPPLAAKRQPTGAKKTSKPRRLRFKTKTDRKKFLRSIEELEGVSIEGSSHEDDCEVVTQSLMKLEANSTDDEDEHLDIHILAIQPNTMEYDDAVMEDVTLTSPNEGNQNQTPSANQDPLALASQESVSHIHIEGQAEIGIPATHLLPSTPDYASLSSSDTALLDGPNIFEASTPLPKVLKIEENPFSPNLLNLDDEMYPALPEPQEPSQYQQVIQLPHGRINVNGTYYIPVPPPHNEVVATSSVPTTSKVRLEAPTPTPRTSVESSSRRPPLTLQRV